VLKSPARSGRGDYEGVCSNYVARQDESNVLYAFIKDTHSSFRLPADPMTPVIMVGPGTGLAPFRGFLQERAAQKASGLALGPSMTFFGCRHAEQDYIYRDELESFAAQGVTELHVAFSRMGSTKVYVQDLLREHADRVWSLLGQGAVIYVCGDASKMEPDVKRALVDIAASRGRMSAVEAEQFVSDLSRDNRYRVDVWASN
jgi:cytochrome P450/NADPH-cytochrome P450 reductase